MGGDLFSVKKHGLHIWGTLCLVRSGSVASAGLTVLLGSLLSGSIRSLSNFSVVAVLITVHLQQQR